MEIWKIAGQLIGTAVFLVWVFCMISWVRRGVTIPRYIHLLAIVLTSLGVGCAFGLAAGGVATLSLAAALVLLPLVGTYFGWFWLFGPEFSPNTKEQQARR